MARLVPCRLSAPEQGQARGWGSFCLSGFGLDKLGLDKLGLDKLGLDKLGSGLGKNICLAEDEAARLVGERGREK